MKKCWDCGSTENLKKAYSDDGSIDYFCPKHYEEYVEE